MGFSNKGMRIRWSLHCNHNVPVFLVFCRFTLVLLLQISLFSVKRATFWRTFLFPPPPFYKKAVKPIRYQSSFGFSHLTRCCYSLGCMLRYVMAHKKKDDIRERGCRQAHDGLMTDVGLNPNRSLGFLCVVRQREIL